MCVTGGNEQLHGSCAAHELGSFDRADGGRRSSLPLHAMARGGSVTPGGARERKYERGDSPPVCCGPVCCWET